MDAGACAAVLALELAAATIADLTGATAAAPAPAVMPAPAAVGGRKGAVGKQKAAAAVATATAPSVPGGGLFATLAPALLALTPADTPGAGRTGIPAALRAAVAALQKAAVTVLRTATSEKAVRRIAERWGCEGAAAGGMAADAAASVQAAVARIARTFV
jgi:hypothetical protein